MMHMMKISLLLGVLGLAPMFSVLGGETMKELPGNSMETTTSSMKPYVLEGKLLAVEGEFGVMEDMSGNQHRVHIGEDTTLPQSPKQPGDSIHAVVSQNGHAQLIQ